MSTPVFSINNLEIIDSEDRTIKTLLARFRIEITNQTQERHILVARNQQQTKVLGILVAEENQKQTLKITYIYVKPIWRRLSIGNALIHQLENDCLSKGITSITATFDHQNHAMNALTTSKKGWSKGEQLNAYTFISQSAMEPVLSKLEQTMQYRNHQTTIKPLSKCNPQDILKASDGNHVPEWAKLKGFNLCDVIEEYSRIFIKGDQIIGWLITFPLLDEILDYRILWVNEDHRKTGIAIRALTAIIRQAHFQDNIETATPANDHGNPWPKGFFIMHSQNQAMINFANKRLVPGTNQRSTLIYREKPIKQRVGKWKGVTPTGGKLQVDAQ